MSKITKAILTGGGRATRLRPLTSTINKHLIPLANRPMIFHAIEKAVEAGIEEIYINTNPGEDQLQKVVGDGSRWSIKIKYFEQTGGPQGIAHVVKLTEKFVGDEPFMFYLSDNIVLGSLKPFIKKFEEEKLDCLLALSKVPDPRHLGVAQFDTSGKLIDILEKPQNPPSDMAVTGIYLYNKNFFKAFDHIKKSARGEYEISDIHSYLLKNGYKVGYQEITGWWKDTGKPEDLILANRLLMEANQVKVEIGKNTRQGSGVKFIAPVIIGDGCVLENCVIGPYTTLGAGTTVKNTQIANSIILDNCRVEAQIKISDSIIGKGAMVVKDNQTDFHRLLLGAQTLVEF